MTITSYRKEAETLPGGDSYNPVIPKSAAYVRLSFKGDLVLEFRALPAESRSRFARWFVGGYRRMANWTRDVFTRRRKGSKETIEIWLNEDDSRLLFWSLPKQFSILLLDIP